MDLGHTNFRLEELVGYHLHGRNIHSLPRGSLSMDALRGETAGTAVDNTHRDVVVDLTNSPVGSCDLDLEDSVAQILHYVHMNC